MEKQHVVRVNEMRMDIIVVCHILEYSFSNEI